MLGKHKNNGNQGDRTSLSQQLYGSSLMFARCVIESAGIMTEINEPPCTSDTHFISPVYDHAPMQCVSGLIHRPVKCDLRGHFVDILRSPDMLCASCI